MTWRRPVPVVGDPTSATERAADPMGWAFPPSTVAGIYEVIRARRDIRRFRPDAVDEATLLRLLTAAHAAPSVGHSQPWRFVVVQDAATKDRAAWMADRQRLAQAAQLDEAAAGHLLDLQLEGIREAPLGIVVCCDRRVPGAGVLGRATFPDADLWSCSCAIENLWLAARAEGLGMGWVTLFRPDELAELLGLPAEVVPLGWLCLGWPDERPPEPGLERAAWSKRLRLEEVVIAERWPGEGTPAPPVSKLRGPSAEAVVSARDDGDSLLTPPGSLGILDRVVERAVALGQADLMNGSLLLAVGRHPVAALGVSAFHPSVTDEVLAAAHAGQSLGAAAAAAAGLTLVIVDGGSSSGDLYRADALRPHEVGPLVAIGRDLGRTHGRGGLIALGEIGIGNTTVSAALAGLLLGLGAEQTVGRGSAADAAIVDRKRKIVAAALDRVLRSGSARSVDPLRALAQLGGPEFALLAGATLGAVEVGALVVLDGLATSLAALVATRMEPAVATHLVAGHRSREAAHTVVLEALGLEPLLDLRIRAGEGVGASLAAGLLFDALMIRRSAARTG